MRGTTPQTDRSGEPNAELKAKVLDKILRVEPVGNHQMRMEHAKRAVSSENRNLAEEFINELCRDTEIPIHSPGGGHRDVFSITPGNVACLTALRDEYRGDFGDARSTVTLPPVSYDIYDTVEHVLDQYEDTGVSYTVEYEEKVEYELTGPEEALRELLRDVKDATAGEIQQGQ